MQRCNALRTPVGFGAAPTDRKDRWVVDGVEDGRLKSIDPSVIRVGSKIDNDIHPGSYRGNDFYVQQYLKVGVAKFDIVDVSFRGIPRRRDRHRFQYGGLYTQSLTIAYHKIGRASCRERV